MFGDSVSFCHPFKTSRRQNSGRSFDTCFFNTGIPAELLHDQGTVFVGKVTKTLCELLNVKQIKTTAYHPQTNRILEKWHGCLKDMLRKQEEGPHEWGHLLKYIACWLIEQPHTQLHCFPHTSWSIRQLRGPLQALKGGWMGGELKFESSID